MAAEWVELRVGDLVNRGVLAISDGYRVRNEELGSEGIPFVRGGDIGDGWVNTDTEDHIKPEFANRVRAKLTQPGDAAFITKGTVGRVGRLRSEQPSVVFAPQVAYWRVIDRNVLDPGFVFFLMRGHEFQSALNGVKTHGSMVADYVSISQQYDFRFRFPGIETQRAIAAMLGTLDDKIELNRRMNETLEAMARALFESWFVNFDPVRAKLEGRDADLPKPLAELFPDSFEDSELGEIPKGWRVGVVGEFATLSRDSINPASFAEETFDLFSIPAFDEGRRPKAERGVMIKSNKLMVPGDAVLISKLNPRIPRIWLPLVGGSHRAICSTEFLVTLPRTGSSREFLYGLLSSNALVDVFATLATGTSGSHQRVRSESLLTVDTVIPSVEAIDRYTTVIHPLLRRVSIAQGQIDALVALRETLLPRLISGQLPIPEIESAVALVV